MNLMLFEFVNFFSSFFFVFVWVDDGDVVVVFLL